MNEVVIDANIAKIDILARKSALNHPKQENYTLMLHTLMYNFCIFVVKSSKSWKPTSILHDGILR
ncbi:MAG: hypothetical protein IKX24_00100 [Prevotella sp.]|nr:hypothetical protein [Prevotella sp.]